MRILCLDIGSKRIGLAKSDPMGIAAQGLCVIERRGGGRVFDEIIRHVRELEAGLIVVGLPMDEEGGIGPQAAKVSAFTARLKQAMAAAGLDTPFQMWDERYSTATAERRLIEAGVSRQRRRQVIDKMAAAAILQDYLDTRVSDSHGEEGGSDEGV